MAVLFVHLNTFYSMGSWDAESTISKGTRPLIDCASLHIQFTQMSLRDGRLNTDEFTLNLVTTYNFLNTFIIRRVQILYTFYRMYYHCIQNYMLINYLFTKQIIVYLALETIFKET